MQAADLERGDGGRRRFGVRLQDPLQAGHPWVTGLGSRPELAQVVPGLIHGAGRLDQQPEVIPCVQVVRVEMQRPQIAFAGVTVAALLVRHDRQIEVCRGIAGRKVHGLGERSLGSIEPPASKRDHARQQMGGGWRFGAFRHLWRATGRRICPRWRFLGVAKVHSAHQRNRKVDKNPERPRAASGSDLLRRGL